MVMIFRILSLAASGLIALISISSTRAQPGSVEAWPPPHMTELPADYLDRLRPALQQLVDAIDTWGPHDDPVLWVRSGIAAFTLGQRVDEMNAYFERDEFHYSPLERIGFGLFSSSFVRAYGLFNDRTGVIKGPLSAQAQANFEKTLWACAKAHSRLDEARRDVWDQEGSENHHLTSKVSDFLVAQLLKDHPAYGRLKYDDGSTLPEQYEARLAYWHKWIDAHARRGLFEEDGSSYQNYTVEALFNLRDFAEDPLLRRKADMFLDLVFANFAEETLGVQRGGPKTRTKEDRFRSWTYDLLFDAPGDTFEVSSYILPTSNYYPSPAVVHLAKDIRGRGVYSFRKRAPDAIALGSREYPAIPNSNWVTMDRNHTMLRVGFATSNYIIGSHGLDTAAEIELGREQRWQGIVFANDSMARIGMDGTNGVSKGDYISNPFHTVQDRNIMVTRKWGTLIDDGADPHLWVYFSYALDTVEEEDGWIFVRSGDAMAAVKVVEGGYNWSQPWKHSDTFNPAEKSFIKVIQDDSPIITVVNDASDYNHDFIAFKTALKTQPISWNNAILRFATITHEGLSAPGKVRQMPVDLRPSRVNDSPFIRSEWDSGIIYLRKGDAAGILDFSDPQNPVKAIGAQVTPAFPPGTGDAKPIVFSERDEPDGR